MNTKVIAEIKQQLPKYLEGKGITLSKNFHCLNPSHPDKNPSMGYFKDGQIVKCFSCHAQYDVLDLIGLDYGLENFPDKLKKACDIFNLEEENHEFKREDKHAKKEKEEKPPEDFRNFYRNAQKNLEKTDYYKKRGLSEETAKHFDLGYISDWQHPKTVAQGHTFSSPRLIIPLSSSGYLARDTRENISEKSRPYAKQFVGKKEVFNLKALRSDDPIFIVEGELDAMSIYEAGGNAVALGSISMTGRLLKHLENIRPKKPLLLALDNDESGISATKKLSEGLKNLNIEFFVTNLYESYKDANEMLMNDRKLLEENVKKWRDPKEYEREEHKKNSASYLLSDFIDSIGRSISTPYIPTGFHYLDGLLDGGLFEGLYIMGAVSSLGKTTFALQMMDQIAQQGHDVLIFSLEMARYELMAKSISRHTLMATNKPENEEEYDSKKDPKTARGITTGSRHLHYTKKEKQLINEAIKDYEEYAHRVYILEGMGDIGVTHVREQIERHIRITGNKPVVLIDYLQILAPNDVRASDKQNTDKAVLELKRISRDFKIPVIGISSFNRQNYNSKVNMTAFKESGAVEYSSDVLIGLQVSGLEDEKETEIAETINKEKKKEEREIELVVLKNRHGLANIGVHFTYFALFNYFEECEDQDSELVSALKRIYKE